MSRRPALLLPLLGLILLGSVAATVSDLNEAGRCHAFALFDVSLEVAGRRLVEVGDE